MTNTLTQKEVSTLVNNFDIVFYNNLVLNVSKFDHPGGAALLKSRIGTDIFSAFNQTKHSLNAKIMLRDLTIGQIEQKTQSEPLFNDDEIKIVNTHDTIRSQLNLQKPIGQQVSKFTKQQFLIFLNYPKFIKQGQQLRINSDFKEDLKQRTEFWINIPILATIWFILIYFSLLKCQVFKDFCLLVICFAIAMFKWSIIQYYFHRVELHKELNLAQKAKSEEFVKLAKSHLIHHAFPTYPKSIVIGLKKILIYNIVFTAFYSFVFEIKIALFIVVGLLFCVISYDCLHYFFHFGWEPQWKFISDLKRNHLKHHYKNTKSGFGVTNTLWDKILGTQHRK